jgi:hypothetical protein
VFIWKRRLYFLHWSGVYAESRESVWNTRWSHD